MSVNEQANEHVLDRKETFIGKSVPRANAVRLVAGQGKYVDDLKLPRMLHVAYFRSPYAHARIVFIAEARPDHRCAFAVREGVSG